MSTDATSWELQATKPRRRFSARSRRAGRDPIAQGLDGIRTNVATQRVIYESKRQQKMALEHYKQQKNVATKAGMHAAQNRSKTAQLVARLRRVLLFSNPLRGLDARTITEDLRAGLDGAEVAHPAVVAAAARLVVLDAQRPLAPRNLAGRQHAEGDRAALEARVQAGEHAQVADVPGRLERRAGGPALELDAVAVHRLLLARPLVWRPHPRHRRVWVARCRHCRRQHRDRRRRDGAHRCGAG